MGLLSRLGLAGIQREMSRRLALGYMRAHGVKYGENLRIWSLPICSRHSGAQITIGDNVTILNRLVENPAGITHPSVFVASEPGAVLTIGSNVGMSGVIIHCSISVTVEDFVNIGAGVKIYDHDFHPLAFEARRVHDRSQIRRKPVRVCQDAWIGVDAIILKGVTIGERAVVGASAVVTKDVPPDTMVGGNPAIPIGKGRDPLTGVKHFAAE